MNPVPHAHGGGTFVKVFDVLDSGFRDWSYSAFGLVFVALGVALLFAPRLLKRLGVPFLDFGSNRTVYIGLFFVLFALFWTVISFFSNFAAYKRHRALARDGACRIVEGPVEHFVPMPANGHGEESFVVEGTAFRYSDYVVTDAFNTTSSHGGPISAESYVRICYDPDGNAILRLEIRDFRGMVGRSTAEVPFPKSDAAVPNAKTDLP